MRDWFKNDYDYDQRSATTSRKVLRAMRDGVAAPCAGACARAVRAGCTMTSQQLPYIPLTALTTTAAATTARMYTWYNKRQAR
jgi:hypothetical protein